VLAVIPINASTLLKIGSCSRSSTGSSSSSSSGSSKPYIFEGSSFKYRQFL